MAATASYTAIPNLKLCPVLPGYDSHSIYYGILRTGCPAVLTTKDLAYTDAMPRGRKTWRELRYGDVHGYSPPEVDRIWAIRGFWYNIPKAIFYLLKGDYSPELTKLICPILV